MDIVQLVLLCTFPDLLQTERIPSRTSVVDILRESAYRRGGSASSVCRIDRCLVLRIWVERLIGRADAQIVCLRGELRRSEDLLFDHSTW